eukprot:Gb_33051 [translate_table: standard]
MATMAFAPPQAMSQQHLVGNNNAAADKFNHYKKTCPSVGNIGVITVHQSTKETITSTITADREEHKSKSTGRSQIQAGNRPCTIIRDISTLCSEGRLQEAVALLHVMDQQDTPVDSNIYVSLLQACTDMKALAEGKQVHEHMVVSGVSRDVFLRSKLLHMYVKCGSLADARLVFDELPKRNVFFWNMMIRGYASNGFYEETLALYNQMQLDGMHADHFTFPFVLKACASIRDLEQGKEIHDCVKETGLESNVFVGSALVDMYAKCGSLENARQVFDKISQRNNVTWNAMISGYAQSGHCEVTFKLLCQMQQAGEKPNVVTWNAVISGYSQNGYHDEALKIFRQMQMIPVKPNSVTMTSVLPSCANSANLQQGKELHGYIIRNGLDSEGIVGCALVTMYSKCESIGDGRRIFDNMSQSIVPSWNAMIAGYAQNGHCDEALKLFHEMQVEGIKANTVTLASILPSCASLTALRHGKEIHGYICRSGFETDIFVQNALVAMYSKCGSIGNARQVYDRVSKRSLVTWNTMIAGYVQNGHSNEALRLFRQMQLAVVKPDPITISSVLPACGYLAALQKGKEIHDYIVKSEFRLNVFVGNALIDMYSKCGRIEDARCLFDKMSERSVVSWNAMISGYGMHGHAEAALTLCYQMQQAGMKPNHITFIAILSSCSHAGLVAKGLQYFYSMSQEYYITPCVEHFACMVDILGRAGHLDKAHDIIKEMPLEPDAGVWGALLGACRIHKNVELGELAAQHLFELEPETPGYYVLLSNIYAEAGKWDGVARVRTMMKERGVKKQPGCSWIEINNNVHTFVIGDRSHPQSEIIYATLESLADQMKEAGYVPDMNFVLHDVEEEEKEQILCSHSERLAIAFGLINTTHGMPIRITKNLRVCGDCHSATKFISKIVSREIIVRDANRFHLFKDGSCSCGDYCVRPRCSNSKLQSIFTRLGLAFTQIRSSCLVSKCPPPTMLGRDGHCDRRELFILGQGGERVASKILSITLVQGVALEGVMRFIRLFNSIYRSVAWTWNCMEHFAKLTKHNSGVSSSPNTNHFWFSKPKSQNQLLECAMLA